jgi:signal recognition particle receptor subunit alpha
MKDHLIEKNVASPIAQHLCDSVKNGLVGKSISTFQGCSPVLILDAV